MRIPFHLLAAGILAAPLAAQDWVEAYTQNGAAPGDHFGWAIAPISDLDGDGLPEILVGAPGSDLNGRNSGAVMVLKGSDGSQLYAVGGSAPGDILGASIVALADYNGDGLVEFAAGAPYASSTSLWQGRVLLFDGASGAVLDTIQGATIGDFFGSGLAATDVDGDGVVDLAVGSFGTNATDGSVRFYQWNGAGLSQMAGQVDGTPGSAEWLGFSVDNLGDLGFGLGDEMVAGAPFGGAAMVGRVSILSGMAWKSDLPVPAGMAGAGFSVSGFFQAPNAYIAAGAPLSTNGSALLWDAAGTLLQRIDGANPGDDMGYAVRLMRDTNFDSLPDLAVGAPGVNGMGRATVYDVFSGASPLTLFTLDGTVSGQRFGASLAEVGDLTGTGTHDLAIGAPKTPVASNPRVGLIDVWLPPDTNLPPPALTILGSFTQALPTDVGVQNIKDNSDVYYYVGTSSTPSTSQDGFQLDISGLIAGLPGHDYFALTTNLVGGTDTVTLDVPSTITPGTVLYVQAIESRSVFQRSSNVDNGTVAAHPFTLTVVGQPQVGQTVNLDTDFGFSGAGTIVYYFIGAGPGNVTWFGVETGLNVNPAVNLGQTSPDAQGSTSFPWLVPSTVTSGATTVPLANQDVYLSATSWQSGNQMVALQGPVHINP